MTGDSGPAAAADPAILQPVAPSPIVRHVMRPMTRVLNPPVRMLAGRRHFGMVAQIRHVGRRSGRPYVTSVGARRTGHDVVIPLTFGNRSDWSQNVRAAGGCSIRLNGRDYNATRPEFLTWQEAAPVVRSAFGPAQRMTFRALGIRQFMRLQLAPDAQ